MRVYALILNNIDHENVCRKVFEKHKPKRCLKVTKKVIALLKYSLQAKSLATFKG